MESDNIFYVINLNTCIAGGANTKVLDVYGVGWVPKGPKTQKYYG